MSKKISQQFKCSKMMLPEHNYQYSADKLNAKHQDARRRPALDEQYQEQLQQKLSRAVMEQRLIRVKILSTDGCCTYRGIPRRVNPVTGIIDLDDDCGRIQRIKASEVINLDFCNADK